MAKYLEAEVVTLEDWNEYCHYVAGVVGEGLSRLFAESGLEGKLLLYFKLLMMNKIKYQQLHKIKIQLFINIFV